MTRSVHVGVGCLCQLAMATPHGKIHPTQIHSRGGIEVASQTAVCILRSWHSVSKWCSRSWLAKTADSSSAQVSNKWRNAPNCLYADHQGSRTELQTRGFSVPPTFWPGIPMSEGRFCRCSQPWTRKICLPIYGVFFSNLPRVLNHNLTLNLSPSADGKWVHPEQYVRRRTRPAQHEWNSAPYCPDAQPQDFVQPPRPPSHRLLPLTSWAGTIMQQDTTNGQKQSPTGPALLI